MTTSRNLIATRHPWTPTEDALVRDIYPDVPCKDIAALLGRSVSGVYQAAYRLGLKKSAAFFASDLACRVTRGNQSAQMVSTRFKPGMVPWNKGAHYQPGGRCAETQFKKGAMQGAAQHNYLPIGSLRVNRDGYLERKVTDDQGLAPARRWVGVHRLVWAAAHGPIPAGHIITFKAGQRTADLERITADRLDCITRAEHAQRNHPRSKSPELAKLVQLKGAITRQVNRIARGTTESTTA